MQIVNVRLESFRVMCDFVDASRRRVLIFWAFVFSFAVVNAFADVNLSQGEEVLAVDFAVYAFSNGNVDLTEDSSGALVDLFYHTTSGGYESITAKFGRRTNFFSYRGANPIRLYKEVYDRTDVDGDSPLLADIYAEVYIPEGMNRAVVFLYPDRVGSNASGDEFILGVPYDAFSENVRVDRPVFVNMSDRAIAVSVDGRQVIVEAKGSVSLGLEGNSGRKKFKLAAKDANGDWQVVLSTSIPLLREKKILVLIEDSNPTRGSEWRLTRVLLN